MSAVSIGGANCGFAGAAPAEPAAFADTVYRHAYVYTVDPGDSVQQALAVRAGRIVYVGGDAGIAALVGPHTTVFELHGRMLMPGLVDGHMHPLQGGSSLLKCNMNYEQLGVAELQARIQACLDKTQPLEPDTWLEVVNWFQEGMVPAGVHTNRATLDALKTKRPIFVVSSFGHKALVNSRALQLAGVTAQTQDPLGGKVARDASGNPTGILEDAAQELVAKLIPAPTAADNVKSAAAALDALRKQGITTFLDAAAESPSLDAFAAVKREGKAHGARALRSAHYAAAGSRSDKGGCGGQVAGAALRSGRARARSCADRTQREIVSGWRDHRARTHRGHADPLFEPARRSGQSALSAVDEPRSRCVFPPRPC